MRIEHGTYQLTVLPDNIVLVDAIGPWNIEAVENYHNDLVKIVDGFEGKPWRNIAILRCETLFTPEVAQYLTEQLRWRKAKSMISDTVILTESFAGAISKQQMQSMFNSVGITLYFADSLEQALDDIAQVSKS